MKLKQRIILSILIVCIIALGILFTFYIWMCFPLGSKSEYKAKSENLVLSILKEPERAAFAPMREYDFIRKGNIGYISGYVVTNTKHEYIIAVNLHDKSILSFIFDGEEFIDKKFEILGA